MQKILFILFIILVSLNVSAQDDTNPPADENTQVDSTKIKFKNRNIVISVEKDKDRKNRKDRDHRHYDDGWSLFSIHYGFQGYLTPDNELDLPTELEAMELDYPLSSSFGFTQYFPGWRIAKKRLSLQSGIGVSWNTYRFKNDINISTSNDSTSFTFNETIDYDKYKFKMTYLEVPVVLTLRLGNLNRPVTIQAGAQAGLRIGSRVKEKYKVDGAKVKNKIKDDFNLKPYKLEGLVRLGVGELGVYARYSFTDLFDKDKAPEVYPFTIGITAGFN